MKNKVVFGMLIFAAVSSQAAIQPRGAAALAKAKELADIVSVRPADVSVLLAQMAADIVAAKKEAAEAKADAASAKTGVEETQADINILDKGLLDLETASDLHSNEIKVLKNPNLR